MIAALLIAGLPTAAPEPAPTPEPYICGTPDETVAFLYGELGEQILLTGVDAGDGTTVVVFANTDTATYTIVLHPAYSATGCIASFGRITKPDGDAR